MSFLVRVGVFVFVFAATLALSAALAGGFYLGQLIPVAVLIYIFSLTEFRRSSRERPYHRSMHTASYFNAVASRLSPYASDDGECQNAPGLRSELQQIQRELVDGTFSGIPDSAKVP
jgi:hypothetical protein